MKRIFLIFLCLTLLGTLCACRVRLIADPAQADTILQAQQEAQPPQEEEPQPPAQEEPEPPEQESEAGPPAEETPPDTPPQPDETAQAEQPDKAVLIPNALRAAGAEGILHPLHRILFLVLNISYKNEERVLAIFTI